MTSCIVGHKLPAEQILHFDGVLLKIVGIREALLGLVECAIIISAKFSHSAGARIPWNQTTHRWILNKPSTRLKKERKGKLPENIGLVSCAFRNWRDDTSKCFGSKKARSFARA